MKQVKQTKVNELKTSCPVLHLQQMLLKVVCILYILPLQVMIFEAALSRNFVSQFCQAILSRNLVAISPFVHFHGKVLQEHLLWNKGRR